MRLVEARDVIEAVDDHADAHLAEVASAVAFLHAAKASFIAGLALTVSSGTAVEATCFPTMTPKGGREHPSGRTTRPLANVNLPHSRGTNWTTSGAL
jgi:hypothetical protein